MQGENCQPSAAIDRKTNRENEAAPEGQESAIGDSRQLQLAEDQTFVVGGHVHHFL